MNRHEFLGGLHSALIPRTYVEIGINDGQGLARSRTRTIGVDPAFHIDRELQCDLKLVRATSDAFYARPDALDHFPEGVADFTFIDGMHLFEFALRDFINAERTSAPTSVVVFDDMLPRSAPEAARNRHTIYWTGDVFRVSAVLERYRPDLTLVPLDTHPTGLLLVVGLDPMNSTLSDRFDEIIAEYRVDDPQVLPHEIEHRTNAADPEKVLASGVWTDLVAARDAAEGVPTNVRELSALRGSATYISNPPDPGVWPPKPKPQQHRPAARQTALQHVLAVAGDPERRNAAMRRAANKLRGRSARGSRAL
jgi:hypothetical protein